MDLKGFAEEVGGEGPVTVVGGRKQWDLTVEVPPNRLSGLLTGGSAVVLQTAGPEARKVRVPVLGNATH